MAAAKKPVVQATRRINIGFQGGQALAARVESKALADLMKAVKAGDGWHELATDEGAVAFSSGQVIYVLTEEDEQRVGFQL